MDYLQPVTWGSRPTGVEDARQWRPEVPECEAKENGMWRWRPSAAVLGLPLLHCGASQVGEKGPVILDGDDGARQRGRTSESEEGQGVRWWCEE